MERSTRIQHNGWWDYKSKSLLMKKYHLSEYIISPRSTYTYISKNIYFDTLLEIFALPPPHIHAAPQVGSFQRGGGGGGGVGPPPRDEFRGVSRWERGRDDDDIRDHRRNSGGGGVGRGGGYSRREEGRPYGWEGDNNRRSTTTMMEGHADSRNREERRSMEVNIPWDGGILH